MKLNYFLPLLIALAGLSACKSRPATAEDESRGYIVKVGEAAPDFTIRYLDGTTAQLADLQGKVVMVQFTASWCGVCRKEMPHIESDIWQRHKDNPGFVLIGVDYKETAEKTAQFAEALNITYPLTLDEQGERFHKYAAEEAGVTRNVIIDRDGTIAFLTRLYNEDEFAAMKDVIEELLAK